jgi:hypothetical protein
MVVSATVPCLKVVHSLPGRLRVHLPQLAGSHAVVHILRRLPGVREVRSNPRTGNVLLYYDPAEVREESLCAFLDRLPESDGASLMPTGRQAASVEAPSESGVDEKKEGLGDDGERVRALFAGLAFGGLFALRLSGINLSLAFRLLPILLQAGSLIAAESPLHATANHHLGPVLGALVLGGAEILHPLLGESLVGLGLQLLWALGRFVVAALVGQPLLPTLVL